MSPAASTLLAGDAARELEHRAAGLPVAALDAAGLAAVELLLDGALAPMTGFRLAAGDGVAQLALTLETSAVAPGAQLALHDSEGVTLGVLSVDAVSGDGDAVLAGGTVAGIRLPERDLFRDDRHGIAAVRAALAACQRDDAVCVTLRGVPDAAEREALMAFTGAAAVLLRVMDPGDPDRGHQVRQRLRAARELAGILGDSRCTVTLCPDPCPQAGPQQQQVDALYAGNAGCARVRSIGHRHAPAEPFPGGGLCVFFTGLSGSGKSTLARALHAHLVETTARAVSLLDGDVVRRHLSRGLGFSRSDRDLNIRRIGFVASRIVMHGGTVVCAPIAPYAATRAQVRQMVEEHGRFLEVHVATPLEVCEARDRKGLYAKARAGEIKEFTGISDPYETPHDAEIRIDTSQVPVTAAVTRIADVIRRYAEPSD